MGNEASHVRNAGQNSEGKGLALRTLQKELKQEMTQTVIFSSSHSSPDSFASNSIVLSKSGSPSVMELHSDQFYSSSFSTNQVVDETKSEECGGAFEIAEPSVWEELPPVRKSMLKVEEIEDETDHLMKLFELLEVSTRHFGKNSSETQRTLRCMTSSLMKLSRFEEAFKLESQRYTSLEAVNNDPTSIVDSVIFMGKLVWEMNRFSEAILYFATALQLSHGLPWRDEWKQKQKILEEVCGKKTVDQTKKQGKLLERFLLRVIEFQIKRDFFLNKGDLRFEELPALSNKISKMKEVLYLYFLINDASKEKAKITITENDSGQPACDDSKSCSICYDNIIRDEEQTFQSDNEIKVSPQTPIGCVASSKIKQLLCGHKFHAECLDRWMLKKLKCPVCRSVESVAAYTGQLTELVENIRDHPFQDNSYCALQRRILDRVLAEILLTEVQKLSPQKIAEEPIPDAFMHNYTSHFRSFSFLIPAPPLLLMTPTKLASIFRTREISLEKKLSPYQMYNIPRDAELRDLFIIGQERGEDLKKLQRSESCEQRQYKPEKSQVDNAIDKNNIEKQSEKPSEQLVYESVHTEEDDIDEGEQKIELNVIGTTRISLPRLCEYQNEKPRGRVDSNFREYEQGYLYHNDCDERKKLAFDDDNQVNFEEFGISESSWNQARTEEAQREEVEHDEVILNEDRHDERRGGGSKGLRNQKLHHSVFKLNHAGVAGVDNNHFQNRYDISSSQTISRVNVLQSDDEEDDEKSEDHCDNIIGLSRSIHTNITSINMTRNSQMYFR